MSAVLALIALVGGGLAMMWVANPAPVSSVGASSSVREDEIGGPVASATSRVPQLAADGLSTNQPPATATVIPTSTVAARVTPQPSPTVRFATPTPILGSRRTYVVSTGDTLAVVAARFNTTVDAVIRANNIADRNYIQVGQTLVIP